jgi:hypothetical protein
VTLGPAPRFTLRPVAGYGGMPARPVPLALDPGAGGGHAAARSSALPALLVMPTRRFRAWLFSAGGGLGTVRYAAQSRPAASTKPPAVAQSPARWCWWPVSFAGLGKVLEADGQVWEMSRVMAPLAGASVMLGPLLPPGACGYKSRLSFAHQPHELLALPTPGVSREPPAKPPQP